MLISMQEAIKRTLSYEESKKIDKPLCTYSRDWNRMTVKEALADQAIRELLISYGGQVPIKFDDSLEGDELDKAIDEHVVASLEYMIDDDFRQPGAVGTVFSATQVRDLLQGEPNLIYFLQEVIDLLQENPYRDITVMQFVPALIALENIKKPGLSLQYSVNDELFGVIKGWIESGQEYGRLIHHQENRTHRHCHYFDYRLVNGKPSLLWLDSWFFFTARGPFYDLKQKLDGLNKDYAFGGVRLLTQNGATGCHVFALNTAKQAYQDEDGMIAMHAANIAAPVNGEALQNKQLVPAHFMKHTQSSGRLEQFFEEHPAAQFDPVNFAGETLSMYRMRYSTQGKFDIKPMMRSIYDKRLQYLLELRESFGVPAVKL